MVPDEKRQERHQIQTDGAHASRQPYITYAGRAVLQTTVATIVVVVVVVCELSGRSVHKIIVVIVATVVVMVVLCELSERKKKP